MTLQELKRLAAKGESDRLEFKRTTGQRTDAAKTVCAMLNGLGGFVIFGVGDKGELVGQEIGQPTVEEVTNELSRIEPPAFPEVETVTFKAGRSFIVLRVPGSGGLYNFDARYYLRVGPTTRPMPRHQYERRLVAHPYPEIIALNVSAQIRHAQRCDRRDANSRAMGELGIAGPAQCQFGQRGVTPIGNPGQGAIAADGPSRQDGVAPRPIRRWPALA
jgi:hypothetical protein